MSLLLAGATGAIGREALIAAVDATQITRVVALTRKAPATLAGAPGCDGGATAVTDEERRSWAAMFGEGVDAAKLREKVQVQQFDWEAFATYWEAHRDRIVNGDDGDLTRGEEFQRYQRIFSGHQYAAMCLGTTRADAGSGGAFWHVDVDYPRAFAEAVKHFSCSPTATHLFRSYAHVSAKNSDRNSWFLYVKAKGQSDADATAQNFPRLALFRPFVLDRKGKARLREKIARLLVPTISVETCGRAIIADLLVNTSDRRPAGAYTPTTVEVEVVTYFDEDMRRLAAKLPA